MSILVSFPGKFGDLIWALPTLRALARRTGEAIDLMTSADMASICPLIAQQPYIGKCWADATWIRVHVDTQDRMPPGILTPRIGGANWSHVFHLGYRGWPQRPLPFETLDCLNAQIRDAQIGWPGWFDSDAVLDLDTPWIHVGSGPACETAIGFSDDHFELKVGLVHLLEDHLHSPIVLAPDHSRWVTERPAASYPLSIETWIGNAGAIRNADVFLGCNSGLHVLAVACGTPVVMMEPSEARWNPIFFPLGTTGPQVTLVRGNDGQPTWDARHVADALTQVLSTVRTSTY